MRPSAPGSESWKFAATLAWGLLVAAAFVGTQVFTTGVVALHGTGELSEAQAAQVIEAATASGYVLSLSTLASALVCVPLLFALAGLKKGSNLRDYFALRPVPARTLFAWMGVTLALLAFSDGLTWLLGKPIVPEFLRLAHASADPLWLLWLALVVAAPLFEETFFRGFLFTGFAASAAGPVGAIVITSALWAAIHLQYDLYGIATLFVLGVLFGLARLQTGSLYVPLALHAMTNLIAAAEAAFLG
jgi:uncharacterized protein